MKPFTYDALAGRTVFGVGALGQVGDELARLGAQRVFLIVDSQAKEFGDTLAETLGPLVVARWHEVVQHVPFELAERARTAAAEANADTLVCLGGGSSTGLAKAIALTHGLPILAVPTTYAGSEQTPIYGLTDARHKQTGRDIRVMPQVVVYDPALTVGLPPRVTGPSAFNALAHCIESLYAPGCNPVTSAIAMEGVRAIRRSLPRVMEAPDDLDARGDVLYGAYLAGMSFGATSSGIHHKLCHVLGGKFNLVHADTHSIVLPHAVAFNAPALPDEMARLEEALGAAPGDAGGALHDLALESQVPTRLSELGLSAGDLDEAAEAAALEITVNPVPVTVEGLARLLLDAYDGTRPPRRQ